MTTRRVGVVTVGRSDYGIYRPVLRAFLERRDVDISVFVGGSHLDPISGSTVEEIEHDGFTIAARVDTLETGDGGKAMASSMAKALAGFARAFERHRPDLILVLGDRFEMFAAVSAALPLRLPIAHIHGGELTEGALDDAFRHAITKMSHLHFVSTDAYRHRVIQIGEEPWRVKVCGAPALDQLATFVAPSRQALESSLGVCLHPPPVLVTLHPETVGADSTPSLVAELFAAMEEVDRPIVFTSPNLDPGRDQVRDATRRFIAARPNAVSFASLGTASYYGLMANAALMVGNSSSGLIEAPSFGLPVVNVGRRQAGRVRGRNVLDVPSDRAAILAAITRALTPEFRATARSAENPYWHGGASAMISEMLASVPLDQKLFVKKFYDLPNGQSGTA